ncbi:MAG: hypothetical protein JWP37_342 [Mucilaginibacter sp.]|nr:hypothetical protein [Mucilaginibacter sp.]
MKKLLILIPIILFGLFLFLARIGKYNDFHQAKISGKIDTIYRCRDYVMIYVNKVEYRIIPIPLNNLPPLDAVAKSGDKLFKSANNDTLRLVHAGDELYYYTVKKY